VDQDRHAAAFGDQRANRKVPPARLVRGSAAARLAAPALLGAGDAGDQGVDFDSDLLPLMKLTRMTPLIGSAPGLVGMPPISNTSRLPWLAT
jgi:hypothetical protein